MNALSPLFPSFPSVKKIPSRFRFGSYALALLLVLPLTGCVSKSKARAQARRAYAAGHQAAERKAQADAAAEQNPIVAFVGPVKNSTVPWVDGLTLRLAIVSAGYDSIADPSNIVIHRNGEKIQ